MIPLQTFALSIIIAFHCISCKKDITISSIGTKPYETDAFKVYWYSGQAELNSYKLEQSRYGELREGKAMLIFVAEDFSKTKHVKLDEPEKAGKDKVNILKMNFTKNFVTGIYPYSMMLSVFTPVTRNLFPNSFKATMTSQEWCGHIFNQLNLKDSKYNVSSYSYFEQEGDEKLILDKILLEDELWNIIRLDPENLPVGNFNMIPGLFYTRLKHTDLRVLSVDALKSTTENEILYTLSVKDQKRTLAIRFEKLFPHKILSWEESFTELGKATHTKAVLDKTLIIDYWAKNKNEFLYLRDSLNLSPTNY